MFNETKLGYEFIDSKKIIFFGKKDAGLEEIQNFYPQIKFMQIKQTHSDICVSGSFDTVVEADAHFTNQKGSALLIRTADCMPIMIYSRKHQSVLAIHAGWRGVAQQITAKSLIQLNWQDSIDIFVGPHILKNSFEVDLDVRDQLLESIYLIDQEKSSYFSVNENNKFLVNLEAVLKKQLNPFLFESQYYSLKKDTFKNLEFNSYRTDQTKERNLSFIALV